MDNSSGDARYPPTYLIVDAEEGGSGGGTYHSSYAYFVGGCHIPCILAGASLNLFHSLIYRRMLLQSPDPNRSKIKLVIYRDDGVEILFFKEIFVTAST
jgi:hypothetical protein